MGQLSVHKELGTRKCSEEMSIPQRSTCSPCITDEKLRAQGGQVPNTQAKISPPAQATEMC